MTNNSLSPIENNSYETSKYNAVKHGVLSKESVLDWENQNDFDALVADFEAEYQPHGVTEKYLVIELAQIVWRKRRLRMAEKSIVKSSLNSCSHGTINKAIYGHYKIKKIEGKVEDAFRGTEKEIQEEIKTLQEAIAPYQELLERDFTYKEYMQNIEDHIKTNWNNYLEYAGCDSDAESFEGFIKKNYINFFQEKLNLLLVRDAIKYEAICEAVEPTKMYDNLLRYENHLDRKFEKTLTMIIKLQELRRQGSSELSADSNFLK